MHRRCTRAVLRQAVEALEQRTLLTAAVALAGETSVAVSGGKLPASVVAGAPLHASSKVDLTNLGSVAERGTFKIDLFAAPDGSLDGSQSLVSSVKRIVSIRAGKTLVATIPVKSFPATLGDGSYTLLAEVIDKNGNTSVSPTGPVIQVTDSQQNVTSASAKSSLNVRPAKNVGTATSSPAATQDAIQPATSSNSITLGLQPGAPNNLQFHGDAARSGFDQNETVLTPSNVASGFGQIWESPVLDGAVYATPLYQDSILIQGSGNAANHAGDGVQSSTFQGQTLGVVFAATGGGSLYCIAGENTDGTTTIAPGTILWKTHLGNPYAGVDGNSIGVLGTPIIDPASGRIYVAASVTDYLSSTSNPNHGGNNFEVFALSIHDGSLIGGFPLIYTQTLLDSLNQNTLQGPGIAVPFSSSGADQRGALNLNADGSTLYVDFACYGASNPGWMTTVATGLSNGVSDGQTPAIVSAYSSVDTTAVNANGGMWGAGGPAIDSSGNVFVTTGDSPSNTGNPNGDWGDSVLEFGPGQTLTLTGVYTPWNYLNQDTIDSDMGGGSPILVNLPAGSATATELLATGGKQGNGYLADAGNHLNNPTANANGSPAQYPASLTARPPGTENPNQDASLYGPTLQTYWTTNNQGQAIGPQTGPLALFGPYNESSASGNTAKARDTPATFTGPDGTQYVVWAGASKASVGSSTPVAPSLILTKIVTSPGQAPYLQIVAQNTQAMSNPGANLITGNGTSNEIDWVVDEGDQRTDALNNGFTNGAPVLYAYNALTMQPIWNSSYGQLDNGGKYNSIAVARGNLYVGTNRIQAFGLTTDTIVDDAVTGTGVNQFSYQGSGWQHLTSPSTMGTFDATVSTDNVQGDAATLQFTGSAITVYANELSTFGKATISVDGGNTQLVTLTPANSSPNGAGEGDVPVYNVTGLGPGTHTLKILNNSASNTISVDRVEITPPTTSAAQIGVSLTDGNIIPQAQGVVPYTINYNNLGGIQTTTTFSNAGTGTTTSAVAATTGTNASGVVITETVPVNTTADLANSTPGWILQSGTGGAGSTYSFSVGALNAGLTGSVVFSVDLNASIPVGTTQITDNVRITDAASDQSSSTRNTPIPPPQEAKLIFQSEPPSQGSADLPLSPAFTVAVEDQFGNVFTGDSSSTVTLTLNNGTINSGATAQVVNGIATFNNVIIDTAGSYTFTASDGSLTTANSSPFVIENSSKLAIGQQPSQTVAGTAVSPAVTVDVENSAGQIINNDQSVVTLTLNTGHFSNDSTSVSVSAVNGVATFSNLVIDTTGSYTLIASDSLLQQTQTNPFSVVAVGSQLAFTQQPATSIAGSAINPSVALAVEDQFGNIDTSNASNVTVTLSGGPGTLFGGATSATATCVNGVALFNNLIVTATGTYTLTAVDSNHNISSVTSATFNVGTHTLTSIDDNNANNIGGIPQVSYAAPADWLQTPTAAPNNFDGTVTTDSTGGDTATVTFNATLITLYALTSPTAGTAQIFIDGNNPTQINLAAVTTSIQPVFTSGLLTAGSHTITVKVASGSVAIDRFVVGPATPTLVWATPAPLTFDTALDGTELDAFVSNFANFPGTFTYTPAAGTVLPVGNNQVLSVTFAPNDSTDYISSSAQVHITVVKATPVITWTGPDTDMIFGQALGPNQLDATATINGTTVPGTFVYTPGAGTIPPTGANFQLNLTFTPNDTADFNTTTANQNVDVDPANPVITWPKPADITDGQPLTATQLDATANVPGTFVYTPAAGTVLPPGQGQSLGVVFTPSDSTDYNLVGASALINVDYGAPSQLAFTQQPVNTMAAASITPPIAVAVEDSAGSIIPNNSSTVTLTLSSGTFDGGITTLSAPAVNGVAIFGDVAIDTIGTYTITASAASPITSVTSTTFSVFTPLSLNLDFNAGSSTFNNNFTVVNNGGFNATSLAWGSTFGVDDQSGGIAGGGVQSSRPGTGDSIDSTAIYTPPSGPSTVNLSDGLVHTISEYFNASTFTNLSSSDKPLQLGFLGPGSTGFNSSTASAVQSFISARVLGNKSVEFQSCNGAGQGAASIDNTTPTGTINAGDWLQLVFNTRETASGAFTGTFEMIDYGPTGMATGTVVLSPVSYTVSGLGSLGTASAVTPGWRIQVNGNYAGHVEFDNLQLDQPGSPSKLAYLQAPTTQTSGLVLPRFVVAVEDPNSRIVTSDSSTVTITLSHGTFSNGQSSASAPDVNGIAVFNGLQINTPGGYSIRATDTNSNLDPGFAPVNITGGSQLAFVQQPQNANSGATLAPVTVAVQDITGTTVPTDTSTVTLTLNGGTFAGGGTTANAAAVNGIATFSNLAIALGGTYTLTASDSQLTSATSSPFTIAPAPLPPYITASVGAAYTYNPANGALSLTSGTLTFIADAGTNPLVNLTASGSASKVIFNTSEHIAGLTLTGGAQAMVLSLGAARTASNHNVLVIGTLGAANDPTFSVDSSSKLDLTDNDLIVHSGTSDSTGNADYANANALAVEGRNPASGKTGLPDGQWNGNGLDSSAANTADTAAGYEKIALAVVLNSTLFIGPYASWQVGSFNETLAANDIIVKYTYLGDYGLFGKVYDSDAAILQMDFDNGKTNTHTWATGSSMDDGLSDASEAGVFQFQYGLGTGGRFGPQL